MHFGAKFTTILEEELVRGEPHENEVDDPLPASSEKKKKKTKKKKNSDEKYRQRNWDFHILSQCMSVQNSQISWKKS